MDGVCKILILVMGGVFRLILMMGWLIILAMMGVYKMITVMRGWQTDGCGRVEDQSVGTRSRSVVQLESEAKEVEKATVFVGGNRVKWIKHYCSTHRILLVGEGDFSFSACLAKSFGSAANMVATSLDSYGFIICNYGIAGWLNLVRLEEMGCRVIHEVDATTMACHVDVGSMVFDRIVFNFPHAGFNKLESRESQLKRHRSLVGGFFENARRILSDDGEIHITHKTNGFFSEWKIEELAAQCGLRIIEKTAFKLSDYPGYETKYGFGGNKNFNCFPSMTFKFGLSSLETPNGSAKARSTRTRSRLNQSRYHEPNGLCLLRKRN